MNYNDFLKQIKELGFEALREDQPEYMEFVIGTNQVLRMHPRKKTLKAGKKIR